MLTSAFLRAHPSPTLSDDEKALLEGAVARIVRFAERALIVRENAPLSQCTLLLEGVCYRYKDADHGKRQILAIHFPGDFVDLHSFPLKRLEHNVGALTAVTMAAVPHDAVRSILAKSPRLTELLWRSTLIDAAMNREWLVSVGARSAIARLAHLFCELFVRLRKIGRTRGQSFDLPLTQADLGEATGLTAVHTNRMLRHLRERGAITFQRGVATILDFDLLASIGEFDPAYLFLD
jgi:CRP-like cAMP-binding protein